MGTGSSCCGGKATGVVEFENPPIDKRSTGTGTSDESHINEVGTQCIEAENDGDNGRVSPTPSLDSVYHLEEGDRYTKTPEPPSDGTLTLQSQQISSNTQNTGKRNQRNTLARGNNCPPLRSSQSNFNSGNRSYNQHENNNNRGTNPRFVGSIGNSGGRYNSNISSNIHGIPSKRITSTPQTHFSEQTNNLSLHSFDTTNKGGKKDWGPGQRLGTSNSDTLNRRDRAELGSGQRLGTGNGIALNKSDRNYYQDKRLNPVGTEPHRKQRSKPFDRNYYQDSRLDPVGTEQHRKQRSKPFEPYIPTSSTSDWNRNGNQQDKTKITAGNISLQNLNSARHNPSKTRNSEANDLGDNTGNSLSVSGQAMPFYGRRQQTLKSNGFNSFDSRKTPPKSESFFISMEPEVETPNNNNYNKKKTTGLSDAFVITFDGKNISTQPLSKEQNSSDQNSDNYLNGTNTFGDYSYNLSRSNSRSTTLSDTLGSTVASTKNGHVQKRNGQKFNISNNRTHPELPRMKQTGLKSGNLLTEIDALRQHISDLRQLLTMHMHQTQNDEREGHTWKIESDKEIDGPYDLIQKLQGEIVSLEDRLCEKEDQITLLTRQQRGTYGVEHETEVSIEDAPVENEVNDEMSDLQTKFEKIQQDLDREALTRVKYARDASLPEAKIRELLQEHRTNRELLKNNFAMEEKGFKEMLKENNESELRKGKSNDNKLGKKTIITEKTRPTALNNKSNFTETKINNQFSSSPHSVLKDSTSPRNFERSSTFTTDTINNDDKIYENALVRSNTFTKDEQSYNSNNIESSNTFMDTGTDPIRTKSRHTNSFEVQTDIDRDINSFLIAKSPKTYSSTNTTTDNQIEKSVPMTKEATSNTDEDMVDLQKYAYNLNKLATNIPEEIKTQDEEFISGVWYNRIEMSAEELHNLLKEHMQNQEKLRALKMAEIQRHNQKLNEKLQNRLQSQVWLDKEANEELFQIQELVKSVDVAVNTVKSDMLETPIPIIQEIPRTDEEILLLLSQHRQDKDSLISSMLHEKLKQTEALQKKIQEQRKIKTKNGEINQTIGTDVLTGQETQLTENNIQRTSVETNTEPYSKRFNKTSTDQNVDIDGVLQEHRERVLELRQIKEDHGKVHQEKVQERLAKRIKNKNPDSKLE